MKKLNKKGFTIVELVIVIAVIAILAGVLIPTFATVVDKANQSKAMQEAKNEYEAYLAEYAKDLDGTQNLDVVSGKYYFEVRNGKFDTTAKTVTKDQFNGKDDKSKAYKKSTDTKFETGTTYYTATTTEGTTTYAEVGSSATYNDQTTYYVQYDLGSDNVYIYAAD